MDGREQRGLEIAATKKLKQNGALWIVPSQGGSGSYVVNPSAPDCSCPDYETRRAPCKHVFAVEFTVKRESTAQDGATVTETLKVTYRQEWPAYNAAQTNEKNRVAELLHDLCTAIDNPPQGRGRPRLPLSDSVFCAVMKVYGGTSGRRASCDMNDYAERRYIDRAPHYNSIFNALENPDLTPILKAMIEESAAPLKAVETDFAVDSSGFSTSVYRRWYSAKYGREMNETTWLKAHVMIGTTTNVVTSVEVTPGHAHDGQELRPLLERSAQRFNVQRLSADKAYSAARILAQVEAVGGVPFIPFKRNAKGTSPYKGRGKEVWARAFHFFTHNSAEFAKHYHKRSNVETTFHMIKSKFGSAIRSKTYRAQVNEVLCKVLAHNLCCLVQSMYELGVEPEFWAA
ncbi:MAG TPA: transposase [Candidatus Elarobacter sp.]|nr:transposase [Candidatus Elarobacter sp.]